jgi:hypothetical protein
MSLDKDSINGVRGSAKRRASQGHVRGSIFLPRFFVSFSSMEKEREKHNTDFYWDNFK